TGVQTCALPILAALNLADSLAGFLVGARASTEADISQLQRRALTVLQAQRRERHACLAIDQHHRRAFSLRIPAVAPLHDADDDGLHLTALGGKEVVDAVSLAALFQNPVLLQQLQALGQDALGHAEMTLEIIELVSAPQRLADDQHIPPVTQNIQGPS